MSDPGATYYRADRLRMVAPGASFPWTICVLFYGAHPRLCHRFLDSIYRYTDPKLFELRAGLNNVCEETRLRVEEVARIHGNVRIFGSEENLYKCPMMRRMFYEPRIESTWVVWFDDDSFITGANWALDVAIAMEACPEAGLMGSMRFVDASAQAKRFVESASWYRGRPAQVYEDDKGFREIYKFPVGSFWVARMEALNLLDWPDRRLTHFGDDYILGEAMWQNGIEVVELSAAVNVGGGEPRRAPADAPPGV